MGAIILAIGRENHVHRTALLEKTRNALDAAIPPESRPGSTFDIQIADYNDAPELTHEGLTVWFDKAIAQTTAKELLAGLNLTSKARQPQAEPLPVPT